MTKQQIPHNNNGNNNNNNNNTAKRREMAQLGLEDEAAALSLDLEVFVIGAELRLLITEESAIGKGEIVGGQIH